MIFMSKRILAAACAAATALALSACSSTPSSEGNATKDGTLTVMASFYPLQYLAEKIGGEHVTVTSLTPAGAEPHDLELSPKTVDALASADAVVYLAGFQAAVDEAIEQQAPTTVIDVSPAAELVEANSSANHPSEDEDEDEAQSGESATEEHADHDHEGHHHDMSADPHFWLDPVRMASAATLVGDKLAEADPANADTYKANAKALNEELSALGDDLVAKTATCQIKTFVTAHTAFGYLADRTGLTQVGISGLVLDPIESQTDSSKDYAAVMKDNINALTTANNCQ